MHQRHRGAHCLGEAGIAFQQIFISTGRDSQLSRYKLTSSTLLVGLRRCPVAKWIERKMRILTKEEEEEFDWKVEERSFITEKRENVP